jgi:hypothetical protein
MGMGCAPWGEFRIFMYFLRILREMYSNLDLLSRIFGSYGIEDGTGDEDSGCFRMIWKSGQGHGVKVVLCKVYLSFLLTQIV